MDEQKQTQSADAPAAGATFALDPDDPRTVENRGGLEAVAGGEPTGHSVSGNTGAGGADVGITGANVEDTDEDRGAAGTGQADGGQLGLSTTGLVFGDSAPAGAGPTEGSASGAHAPRVEMTDVGLADVNEADMSLPGDGTAGARVEDDEGNPL